MERSVDKKIDSSNPCPETQKFRLTNLPSTRNDVFCPVLVSMTAIIPFTFSGKMFQKVLIQEKVKETKPTTVFSLSNESNTGYIIILDGSL